VDGMEDGSELGLADFLLLSFRGTRTSSMRLFLSRRLTVCSTKNGSVLHSLSCLQGSPFI
jgi:hypothetical protein